MEWNQGSNIKCRLVEGGTFSEKPCKPSDFHPLPLYPPLRHQRIRIRAARGLMSSLFFVCLGLTPFRDEFDEGFLVTKIAKFELLLSCVTTCFHSILWSQSATFKVESNTPILLSHQQQFSPFCINQIDEGPCALSVRESKQKLGSQTNDLHRASSLWSTCNTVAK